MKLSVIVMSGLILAGLGALSALAKEKAKFLPDDPTYQLFQILDDSYGGKLTDFCVLANVYKDPQNLANEFQHVLRVDYDKHRFFGRLQIDVRSVAKLTPTQLKTYTPKQIFDFGEADAEKFEKIEPGPFRGQGDLYLRSQGGGPLREASITEHVSKEYETFLTQYVLPALKKK